MTSKRKPFPTQLRRSISEQLRDSTARAWDLLWKNVRERRLAAVSPELVSDHGWKRVLEKKKV
uniref:StAR related lipid transfer domain containing 13 n=1 Tax=Lynx canadensis TaxID=61383 RepID=A0A667FEF4_LYNCA